MSSDECVLIIDGDPNFRATLADRLEGEAISSLLADSGQRALQIVEESCDRIKTIVSEFLLSDQTGLTLLNAIRDKHWAGPVIFVAAHGGLECAKRAIRAGAFEYYDKPVDMDVLTLAVRQAVHTVSAYRGTERRSVPARGPVFPKKPGDRDELTGLVSHRFVLGHLAQIRKESRREGRPVSLCMLDIDGFRQLNTHRGLSACDQLLVDLARRLRRLARTDDIIGRYGGDEFLAVLPGSDVTGARRFADRIVTESITTFQTEEDSTGRLGLCIGVVSIDPGDGETDLEFIDRVIEAVHHAKLAGPGTIVVWHPHLSQEHVPWHRGVEESDAQVAADSTDVMMWRFRELSRQLLNVSEESLRVLVAAVEARDPYTKDHSVRVAALSRCLADEIGLPDREGRIIHSASLLHDIGKIGIPDAILTKSDELTDEEMVLIRQHPAMGATILEQTRFFSAELPLIRYHHEWYNGRGYPEGLQGEDIPLGSRIIHIADAVEAMMAQRSYKGACTLDYVVEQLAAGTGGQFDPKLTGKAIELIESGVLDRIWDTETVVQGAYAGAT